jgi:hypothetical protein
MPFELQSLLYSYQKCTSRQETYGWTNRIATELLAYVKIIPFDERWGRERAYCPLCGSGSQGPYDEGYALPEGLRRHITGHGNTHECAVIEQIRHLAMDYWDDQFAEQERIERQEALAVLKSRRESETLYAIKPNREPQLIDEIITVPERIRSEEDLMWAESRLLELGIEKTIHERIVSYIFTDRNLCIYANPLEQKEIRFYAYKDSVKHRSNARFHYFSLSDTIKKNIKEHFENNLSKAREMLKIT